MSRKKYDDKFNLNISKLFTIPSRFIVTVDISPDDFEELYERANDKSLQLVG